jgi:signal transduction histidine kinase
MRTLLRVLVLGFAVVIALLVAAAVIGVQNARSITASTATLVADQLAVTRLLDEVEREQQALNAVFYRLSRAPENVDRADLDETGGQVAILVQNAHGGPDEAAWNELERAVLDFSAEARQLLNGKKAPGFSSRDLFVRHEEVTTVVAHLADLSYARAADTRRRVDAHTDSIVAESALLIGGCLLVALVSAIVTVRIAARVFREMEAQTSELSRVSFRMLETQEATARRFSHELHDELGGSLTAIKTNLTNAEPNMEEAVKLIDDAIDNVRTLSQLLRPTILDDFGLDAGIRWLAERFSERTDVDIDYRSHFDGRLADETETHLFRIVQEAFTNIARHANASRVTIFLRAENQNIRLTISDNGRGLVETDHTGMGLTGMRARARSAGGDCTISSTEGGGVTIDVTAPMEQK